MTLVKLIELYKIQVRICAAIDYHDKKTLRANKKAVRVMYEIVEKINTQFGAEGIKKFAGLLNVAENNTCLWVAAQLLEKTQPGNEIKRKALEIIKNTTKGDSAEAFAYQLWLADWEKKNKK